MISLLTALLAAILLAGCGSTSAPTDTTSYGGVARDAGSRAQALTSFSENARLDFAFINASHADTVALTIDATASGSDFQATLTRQGMGLSAQEQWIYWGGGLYTGDGTVWKTATSGQGQTDPPQPPRSLLDDLKSFEVTAAGPDLEWGGATCHSYTVSCGTEVVWIYAPTWLRELDANLDFRCKGEIYVGTEDGLPRRIFLRLEGTERGTGLLKLAVNLDAGYARFDDASIKITNPLPPQSPGS